MFLLFNSSSANRTLYEVCLGVLPPFRQLIPSLFESKILLAHLILSCGFSLARGKHLSALQVNPVSLFKTQHPLPLWTRWFKPLGLSEACLATKNALARTHTFGKTQETLFKIWFCGLSKMFLRQWLGMLKQQDTLRVKACNTWLLESMSRIRDLLIQNRAKLSLFVSVWVL